MTLQAPSHPTAEGITERFDPIDCLDERSLMRAEASDPLAPGRYIEVQGPDRTATIPLDCDVLHIGRGIAADLRIDENSVSRRHAVIATHEHGARILDDRSSNGTFLNGSRIQQAELQNGDMIAIGRVLMRYVEILDAEQPEPAAREDPKPRGGVRALARIEGIDMAAGRHRAPVRGRAVSSRAAYGGRPQR